MLVTQRDQGTMLIVSADGRKVEGRLAGIPDVVGRAHGGLLDVALDPDFATDPWVYWSYAEAGEAVPARLPEWNGNLLFGALAERALWRG